MTTKHPAHGPVSLDRLHQIRETLSKAAAQSDGGNLGYAMADAVKVIEGVIAAFGAEPVLYAAEETLAYARMGELHLKCLSQPMGYAVIPLYTAPTAQVVPENCVTAEHRRVIEMLLNVCGAAFELADDNCQQDVDGEECHVVPDDAFQKLSDALDEIENTLPTEDVDRPDVFLAWSAMPRAALKSILQAGNSPVTPDCWCRTCRPVVLSDMRFVVCPDCGNKRCPRANDHKNSCTGSNELGQEGSAYPASPQEVKGE
ncbi:hypothetical protein [Citrobacter portucalensis]|uniref:hypothetical protein n=1 Tax=Citrobacter portucalensis TaxID=1639133 RepID=UPI0018E2A718|nr:hypothetical protein [Citrobacter portucalensis]MBI1681416.1 hypothetical protein [Citrobacter portucalensis]